MKGCIKSNGSIEWVDKETLRYSRNGYSVLVWVDYEPGLFNSGRIIKASSILKWDARPESAPNLIDIAQRQEIIEEIQRYFNSQNKKCRIEQ